MALEIFRIAAGWTAFALVHSLTVSDPYHAWLRRQVGDTLFLAFNRLAYTVLSLATFISLVIYLRALPDSPLYAIPGPWRYILRGGQLCALLFLLKTPLSVFSFLGFQEAAAFLRGARPAVLDSPPRLYTQKTYGIVRHPLYLGCSVLLAFQPDQTLVSCVSSLMAILYFYVGTFHEERRLLKEFGEAYRIYQGAVPRLLPLRIHKRK